MQQERLVPPAQGHTYSRRTLRRNLVINQGTLYLILGTLLLITFVPFAVMLSISLRDNGQIFRDFFGLPQPWRWENYVTGFQSIARYALNTVVNASVSVVLVVTLSSLSGFVFARHRFPGREVLYLLILALLMIPGILTLIPAFVLTREIGIWNTPLAVILPWTAGGQVIGIFLARNYIEGLPEELFESGRIDGASEFQLWYMVAVPLCWPILMTIGILHMVNCYNDYVWPLLVLGDRQLQVVSVGLTQFQSQFGVTDYGPQMAAYVIASLPLLLMFVFGMRFFVQGLTSGALKG